MKYLPLFLILPLLLFAQQQPDPNQKQKEIKGATAWEVIAHQKQMIISQQQAQSAEQSFQAARQRTEALRKQLCEAEKAPLEACQIAVGTDSVTVVWREPTKAEKKPEAKKK